MKKLKPINYAKYRKTSILFFKSQYENNLTNCERAASKNPDHYRKPLRTSPDALKKRTNPLINVFRSELLRVLDGKS